jgi:hypothetical protein
VNIQNVKGNDRIEDIREERDQKERQSEPHVNLLLYLRRRDMLVNGG